MSARIIQDDWDIGLFAGRKYLTHSVLLVGTKIPGIKSEHNETDKHGSNPVLLHETYMFQLYIVILC